jgi:hypothetical protein
VDPTPIVEFRIEKYKDNKLDKICGYRPDPPPAVPGIDIAKQVSVDGGATFEDADTPPGRGVSTGDPVVFRFVVTNTGNVTLSPSTLTDTDFQTEIDAACSIPGSLAPGASFTCDVGQPGGAQLDQHVNTATAAATFDPGVFDPIYYGAKYEVRFHFADGTIVEGSSTTNEADLGLSAAVHVSCSDAFGFGNSEPDGWGEKGAPVQGVDPTPLAGYAIVKFKDDGSIDNSCSGGASGAAPSAVSDTDSAHYLGTEPPASIDVEKQDQFGNDADTGPGPTLLVGGQQVRLDFVVTNTGSVPLDSIAVADDVLGAITSCPRSSLNPGESMTCLADFDVAAGPHRNTATVTADGGGITITDSDPYHYVGASPGATLVKRTNEVTADTPPGPFIPVGDTVTWSYELTNDGPFPLDQIQITDLELGAVVCDDLAIAVGESETCATTGTATPGQYSNQADASARATAPNGSQTITVSNSSHYFGWESDIDVEKATNGEDADTAPGPTVGVGATVTWTYAVTTAGNVPVDGVVVSDDVLGTIAGPDSGDDGDGRLEPGETWLYTATGTAVAGPYENTATVSGQPAQLDGTALGSPVSDSDPSHYAGIDVGLDIEKTDAFGNDADLPPGPNYAVGGRDDVTFRYAVTNTGLLTVTGIVVEDDIEGAISCPGSSLGPGESMTCEKTARVVAGPNANTGTVTGSAGGATVTDSDGFHYTGVTVQVDLEKSTNSEDADSAPGPHLAVGDPVTWTYVVTNTGTAGLRITDLTDFVEGAVCPDLVDTALGAGESATCTHTG